MRLKITNANPRQVISTLKKEGSMLKSSPIDTLYLKIKKLFLINDFDNINSLLRSSYERNDLNKSLYPFLIHQFVLKDRYREFITYFNLILNSRIDISDATFIKSSEYLFWQKNHEYSNDIFDYMKEKNFIFDKGAILAAIRYFCFCQDLEKALYCLEILENRSKEDYPTIETYTRIFELFLQYPDSLKSKFRQKLLERFKPDDVLYTTLMYHFLNSKKLNEAEIIFNEIPNPNIIHYSTLLKGYFSYELYEKAEELFFTVLQKKIKVDGRFYGIMIKGYVLQNKTSKVMELLYLIKKKKEKLSNVKFLFDAFSTSDKEMELGLHLFYKLDEFGIEKDKDIYYSLFESLKIREMYKTIIELYEKKDPKVILEQRTQVVVMDAYLELEDIKNAEKIMYSFPEVIIYKQIGDKFLDLYKKLGDKKGLEEYVTREMLVMLKK